MYWIHARPGLTRRLLLTVFATGFLMVAGKPAVASSHEATLSEEQRKEIEQIIHDYIMKSPETILRSVQEHQARQEARNELKIVEVIRERSDELLRDPDSFVAGNPGGDVTMVEFFDYRCGYCKRVHPVVKKLLQDDGDIRLVYKEFPILGAPSVYAARAAIASLESGNYLSFHNALMEARGQLTEERVLFIAEDVGLDADEIEAGMDRAEERAQQIIARNLELAEALKINGTPAFVIGDTVIRGAVDMSTFVKLIAEARKKQKAEGG